MRCIISHSLSPPSLSLFLFLLLSQSGTIYMLLCLSVLAFVCVCVIEREREGGRERKKERERKRERERERGIKRERERGCSITCYQSFSAITHFGAYQQPLSQTTITNAYLAKSISYRCPNNWNSAHPISCISRRNILVKTIYN